jgi:hypothetical protein
VTLLLAIAALAGCPVPRGPGVAGYPPPQTQLTITPPIVNKRPAIPFDPITIDFFKAEAARRHDTTYKFDQTDALKLFDTKYAPSYGWNEYLGQLNMLEAFLNAQGYSLRSNTNGTITLFQSNLAPPTQIGQANVSRDADAAPDVETRSQQFQFGDKDTFWGRVILERGLAVNALSYRVETNLTVDAAVANSSYSVINSKTAAEFPRNPNGGPSKVEAAVKVLSQSIMSFNVEDSSGQEIEQSKSLQATAFDKSIPIQIMLGPIPVIMHVGFRVNAGFQASAMASFASKHEQSSQGPFADILVYADVGVGFDWCRASAGGSVSLAKISMGETSSLSLVPGRLTTCADWTPGYQFKLETAGGSFYVEVAIWLPVIGAQKLRYVIVTTPGEVLVDKTVGDAPFHGCYSSWCDVGGTSGLYCSSSAGDNVCVDVLNDVSNCGGCGHACGSGQACVTGSCYDRVNSSKWLTWSWDGGPSSATCLLVSDPDDKNGWDKTYLCGLGPQARFIHRGDPPPRSNEKCIKFANSKDSHTPNWANDYLCIFDDSSACHGDGCLMKVPPTLYATGKPDDVPGSRCVKLVNPRDQFWADAFLCYPLGL